MTRPDPRTTMLLSPDDAVAVWQERGRLRPTVNWREMMNEEHASAFTVAKIARLDLLASVQRSLDDVIRNGGTFEQWKANILPELQRAGWWGVVQNRELTGADDVIIVNDARLRTIYRTNIRMSIAAGRWRKFQREKDLFPYLRYRSDHYRKQPRLDHQSWHGIILPVDDPTWAWMFPPNGWGCNCMVEQVSAYRMQQKGWTLSQPPDPGFTPFATPNGEIMVPNGVSPGFGYNPGTAHLQVLADKLAASEAAAVSVGMTTPAAVTRQQVSHKFRDAALTGAAVEQRVAQGVFGALSDRRSQSEIALDDVVLQRFEGRTFQRTIPYESVRKVMRDHGQNSADVYQIVHGDWPLASTIMRFGRHYVELRRDGTRSLIHVLRVGDLDYVVVERLGMKRGNRLRLKSFFIARRYRPNPVAEEIKL